MARLERGKGRNKRTIEIRRHGTLLTHDETDGPSIMLTGYRRFGSEKAAQGALAQQVAKYLGEKLLPADEEAKAIASALPTPQPKGVPTLPLRRDFYVYNEATGFMLTSMRMAGKTLEEGSSAWNKAVQKGDILPCSLIQDDPFVVRVVVGEELTPAEAEEWVARIDWHLDVKDGELAITGGAPLVGEDYDADDSYNDQFVRTLKIPKGRYRVTVYAHVPGVNGKAALDQLSGGYDRAEPLGQWFRRTRPGESFPPWLRWLCIADRGEDPGHEQEWDGVPLPDDVPDTIGFLLHLVPVQSPPTDGLTPLPPEGWFGETCAPRKPERCPLGLEGRDVSGHIEENSGNWLYARDVFGAVESHAPARIGGGPVAVPLGQLGSMFRLPWFCTRMAVPALRATLPSGARFEIGNEWPAGMVAAMAGEQLRLHFSNDLHPNELFPLLDALAAQLRRLPDGSVLELATQPPEQLGDGNPETGLHRYVGELRAGEWHIDRAYPKLTASVLKRALALANEIANARELAIASAEEGAAVLKWAKGNFGDYLDEIPARVDGTVLRLAKESAAALALYGVALFAQRFGSTWPVNNLADDEDEDGEQGDPWDLDEPPRGPELLRTPGGRVYFHTMALLWTDALAQRIKAAEPPLRAIKFAHVADVLCDQHPAVPVRGYARRDGTTWVLMFTRLPDALSFACLTRFADGAALITCDPALGIKELVARHEERLAPMEAGHSTALRTVPNAEGVAQAVELAQALFDDPSRLPQ